MLLKCDLTKEDTEFYDKKCKNGIIKKTRPCKECCIKKDKEWREKNIDRHKETDKEYYKENRERILKNCEEYRKTIPQEVKKEYRKNYYAENVEKSKAYNKKYYKENKDKIIERNNKPENKQRHRKSLNRRNKERRAARDIQFILSVNIRARIRDALNGKTKPTSIAKALGCSIEELKLYLEAQFYDNKETGEKMTWENYGLYGWYIDHIIHISYFNLTIKELYLKACVYTNLQPLWAKENLSKGDKLPDEVKLNVK